MEEYERLLQMHVQMFCFGLSSSKVIYLFIYLSLCLFLYTASCRFVTKLFKNWWITTR